MFNYVINDAEGRRAIEVFSGQSCNLLNAQRVMVKLGFTIGHQIAIKGSRVDFLCPILRAGLPLAVGVSEHFPQSKIAPIHAKRMKGTGLIAVERIPDIENGARLLLIDTIAATGGTLVTLARMLKTEWDDLHLMAAIGYASPEALQRLTECGDFESTWVGHVAQGVDADGFLFPSTNGDAGDKMFHGIF